MISQLFRRKTDFSIQTDHQLPRILSVRDLTFFGIAAIIGGGIFSSIGKACAAGGPGVIWLFVISAIACGFAALSYAEFAGRIPVSGSAYTYAYASFGELFAWIIGWALLMEYAIGNIYIAYSWSGYFTHLLDAVGLDLPRWLITDYSSVSTFISNKSIELTTNIRNSEFKDLWANTNLQGEELDFYKAWVTAPVIMGQRIIFDLPAVLINVLITVLVYRGISESRRASNTMVILKVVIILLVIVVGAFYIDFDNFTPFNPNGMSGIMTGVSAVFFTYIGFDAVSTLAEESKNPKRDLPRGMFYSLLICTVLYILISLVLTGMVPFNLLGVDDPLAFALNYKRIHWLEYIVSVSAIVAMTSVLLVFQMGQPRIWMSMSRDGLLPEKFSQIHPKFKTPGFATIITGLVVGIPIFFTNETFVLDFTSIGTIFAFVLVCGGVLLLPPRTTEQDSGFKLVHIDAKYLFPALIIISAILTQIYIPDYFRSLLALDFYGIIHLVMWFLFVVLSIFAYLRKWNIIPLMGVSTCMFLLTGMTLDNWKWFGLWFLLGLILYFSYGYKHSKLKNVQS
ncbi:MAG: amino acid permease [Bacteroidia bacterium]|nr:amino acid permease [Bacteroidia bacterium]